MPQTDNQFTANSGNVEKFKLSSNANSNARDLSPGVVDFRYYESILSNAITATATVVETGFTEQGGQTGTQQGTIDWLPIRGGERTDILIEDAQDPPNQINFDTNDIIDGLYVNRVRNVNPGTQKDTYFLDFSSKEYFSNEKRRVVRKYEEKISDNVEQIVEELLLGTWATRNGGGKDIDETAIPYNFIGNDRKPFYICTWLASKSVPAGGDGVEIGGAGGYFFWQTRDGFHFRSIDKIFGEGNDNRDSLKKYIYNMSGDEVEGYDANIVSYDIDSNVDLGEKLSLGAYNNRSIFFDYYSFSYVVRNFNITEQEGKVATAGSDYDNVAEEFTASPTRLMSHIMDYGVLPKGINSDDQLREWRNDRTKPNYDAPNTMVQSIMRYNQLFTVSTTVVIPGDFSIKAGDTIICDFPELDGSKNSSTNDQSGGLYMVAEVCHRITSRDTFTSMRLVRDSFGSTS